MSHVQISAQIRTTWADEYLSTESRFTQLRARLKVKVWAYPNVSRVLEDDPLSVIRRNKESHNTMTFKICYFRSEDIYSTFAFGSQQLRIASCSPRSFACFADLQNIFNPSAIYDHLTLIPTQGLLNTYPAQSACRLLQPGPDTTQAPQLHSGLGLLHHLSRATTQPRSTAYSNSLTAQAAAPLRPAQVPPHWRPGPNHPPPDSLPRPPSGFGPTSLTQAMPGPTRPGARPDPGRPGPRPARTGPVRPRQPGFMPMQW